MGAVGGAVDPAIKLAQLAEVWELREWQAVLLQDVNLGASGRKKLRTKKGEWNIIHRRKVAIARNSELTQVWEQGGCQVHVDGHVAGAWWYRLGRTWFTFRAPPAQIWADVLWRRAAYRKAQRPLAQHPAPCTPPIWVDVLWRQAAFRRPERPLAPHPRTSPFALCTVMVAHGRRSCLVLVRALRRAAEAAQAARANPDGGVMRRSSRPAFLAARPMPVTSSFTGFFGHTMPRHRCTVFTTARWAVARDDGGLRWRGLLLFGAAICLRLTNCRELRLPLQSHSIYLSLSLSSPFNLLLQKGPLTHCRTLSPSPKEGPRARGCAGQASPKGSCRSTAAAAAAEKRVPLF